LSVEHIVSDLAMLLASNLEIHFILDFTTHWTQSFFQWSRFGERVVAFFNP